MPRRSIVLFPESASLSDVQQLRQRFDPLADAIKPHITLVFPFESRCDTSKLRAHIASVTAGIGPFSVLLHGITGSEGSYLFLNVKKGNDVLIALHDRLYTGVLAAHRNRAYTYTPHMTVGRLADEASFRAALEETASFTATFEARIEQIVLETIGDDEQSVVECVVPLLA